MEKEAAFSIGALALLLFSALTFLSFFAQAASVNFALQNYLNKLFGWGVFLVPPILGLAGLTMLRTLRFRFISLNSLLGVIVFFFSAIALVHLILFSGGSAYDRAVMGEGGGVVGFFAQQTLKKAFSATGAALVLFSALLLSIIITFNASLDGSVLLLGRFLAKAFELARSALSRAVTLLTARLRKRQDAAPPTIETPAKEAPLPQFQVLSTPVEPERKPLPAKTTGDAEPKTVSPPVVPFSSQVWEYPPLDLLEDTVLSEAQRGDVKANAAVIERTLSSFGIKAQVAEINLGPAVTQYALESAQGTKIAKITNLQNDLAMALASPTGSVRIEAPIPGKSLIGIEVPNYSPAIVHLKGIIDSDLMKDSRGKITVALGLNVAGMPVIANIAKMPHVLIAGATGSGKSVLLHSFLATVLFRASPDEVKFILIDPKRVELTRYNGIPHLLTRPITDPEKAVPSLKWAVAEMERRYKLFEEAGSRDMNAYNELSGFQALPYIIIVVDELADLMATAPAEVEKVVTRLAQMSRATGIHLILATQRPSVDVLTGLIKANIPCRIAFNVTSQVDSRVIIDQGGAEKLLGRGDMLYVPPDAGKPMRIQGVFVAENELNRLLDFLRAAPVEPEYQEEVTEFVASKAVDDELPDDALFAEAVRTVCQYDRASASLLQRRLRIGYARAARLLDELEERGIVGESDGSKPRDVLMHDPEVVLSPKNK